MRLLGRAVWRAFQDNCFEAAKGAAFSTMLTVFPGLLVVAAILIRENVGDIVPEVSRVLARVLPRDAHRLATQFLFAGEGAQGLLVGAAVVALWSASGVILSLKHGLHAAYRVPEKRGMIHSRLVALAAVLLAGVPLAAATALLVFGQLIERWLIHTVGGQALVVPLARLARTALALGTCVTVLCTVYRFVPNRKQKLKFVWRGAAVATLLWWMATAGFTWYVSHVARYRDFYGSLSTVVVFLIWSYIVSLLVLIGGEFNAEYEALAKKGR